MIKRAKLFSNGKSQAVRLPKEFRFKGREVYVKQEGNVVVLFPISSPWQGLLNSLEKFSGDFMSNREQIKIQKRDRL